MEVMIPADDAGLREVRPRFCGWEPCESSHSYGPAVRDFYLIHCALRGRGLFACGGRSYALAAGECFLICPGDVTYYRADETQPWEYCWIAFDGTLAGTLLARAGLSPKHPVFGGDGPAELFAALRERIASGQLGDSPGFTLLSFLFELFARLPRVQPPGSPKEQYVEQAKNYIDSMLTRPVSVERLADYCGLDRRYLGRVFRDATGKTLKQYITDGKMQQALELLRTRGLSVGNAARSVGYDDVYHFSKMFKKHFGVCPNAARRECRARGG